MGMYEVTSSPKIDPVLSRSGGCGGYYGTALRLKSQCIQERLFFALSFRRNRWNRGALRAHSISVTAEGGRLLHSGVELPNLRGAGGRSKIASPFLRRSDPCWILPSDWSTVSLIFPNGARP